MRLLKLFSIVFAAAAAVLFGVTVLLQFLGRDTQGPEIAMNSDRVEISVSAGDESILAGVTAQDSRDGDVTDSLVVESLSNFVSDGERIASIAAFDSDNHVTKTTRTVHYTDYTPPVFALSSPFSFPVGTETDVITGALTAADCLDGDITHRIVRANVEGSSLRTDVAGYYPVTFSVSNSAGDIEKFTATVEIYDLQSDDRPSLTLTESLIYLEAGAEFSAQDYLKALTVDNITYQNYNGRLVRSSSVASGDITSDDVYAWDNVTINNPVDVQTPGWYEVSYTVTSAIGNARTAYLPVCVKG